MKRHALWTLIALGATFAGYHFGQRASSFQSGSLAGQTLTNLSRALETEKTRTGRFPDSLEGVVLAPQDKGDHSDGLLRHVIYRRTEKGFVAFVGLAGVAYIEPGQSCAYEFVK